MPNDKEEIRLDGLGETAGEPDMPGDNTIKPSDAPSTLSGLDSRQMDNLTINPSDAREGAPDFENEESVADNPS
jgi:hypothetical protein